MNVMQSEPHKGVLDNYLLKRTKGISQLSIWQGHRGGIKRWDILQGAQQWNSFLRMTVKP